MVLRLVHLVAFVRVDWLLAMTTFDVLPDTVGEPVDGNVTETVSLLRFAEFVIEDWLFAMTTLDVLPDTVGAPVEGKVTDNVSLLGVGALALAVVVLARLSLVVAF